MKSCLIMAIIFTSWFFSLPGLATAATQKVSIQSRLSEGRILVVFTGEQEMQQQNTFHIFLVKNPPRLGIDFPNAFFESTNISADLDKTLFSGFRYHNYPDKTRVVFDTDQDQFPAYTFSAAGNELHFSFPLSGSPAAKKTMPQQRTTAKRKRTVSKRKNTYPITLDFKDADLQNVFRFLADIKNYNLIMGDDVKGTVTLKLKKVPWRQAFNILLKTNRLGMEKSGNVIRIAPLVRFKEEKEALAQNKKANETLADTVTEIIKVNFATATDVAPRLKSVLSDRGSIDTDIRTNTLIINDIPGYIKQAKNLLKSLDLPIKQVLIEAKIVKIETDAVKDIGIQWGGAWGDTKNNHYYGITGNAGTNGQPGITPDGGSPTVTNNYVVNLPASGATSGLGMIFGKVGIFNLNLRLSALKNKHLANILSTPKILALDNHQARIGQGMEIPYQTTSDEGTTTEFKKAELSLEVTPHITNNDNVSIDVQITKDSIGVMTTDGPAINTQQIETTLLLYNGETAVIGGIIEKNKTDDRGEVPGFSQIPLVGNALFKHKYKKNEQTELLIFITPTVIPVQRRAANF
jgi:type IV pilus assembly protein PilQ